jgi:hypothetical protein
MCARKSLVFFAAVTISMSGCGLNSTSYTLPDYSEVDVSRISGNLQTVRERMLAAKLEGKFTDQEWDALSDFDVAAKTALSRYKVMLLTDGKYANKVELLTVWNEVSDAYTKARSQVAAKWDTLPVATREALTGLDKEAAEISNLMQKYSISDANIDTKAIADKTLKIIWIAMQVTAAVL